MVISFRGLPPHDLGLAETGSARAANGMVEVMLQALDDWPATWSDCACPLRWRVRLRGAWMRRPKMRNRMMRLAGAIS